MAFDFESLKAKARELTNTGVNKAKELTEIGKLKVQNVSEQDEIRKAYMAMGKLYFERYGENPGSMQSTVSSLKTASSSCHVRLCTQRHLDSCIRRQAGPSDSIRNFRLICRRS